jgi:hypothetical protein
MLTKIYVMAALWALGFLLEDLLPMRTIAYVTLALCAAAAIHALSIRWAVWMFSRDLAPTLQVGRNGRKRLFLIGITTVGSWYLVASIREGRSLANVIAIETAYLLGVWIYVHRESLGSELRVQVVRRLRG